MFSNRSRSLRGNSSNVLRPTSRIQSLVDPPPVAATGSVVPGTAADGVVGLAAPGEGGRFAAVVGVASGAPVTGIGVALAGVALVGAANPEPAAPEPAAPAAAPPVGLISRCSAGSRSA